MTQMKMDLALIERVCLRDAGAMGFLAEWSRYVHEIDDIVDGERPGLEEILGTFARAAALYSHPFYLANLAALRSVVLLVTNLYADSVAWERSDVAWQRDWADHNRHVGMEMVIAVAMIVGGYEHGRAISREQREICYVEHHDREGRPE